MSQRGIPVPTKEVNAIRIFLSQIFCRLLLCMIDISIPHLDMGFWSNSRWPPCKFGCENAILIVKKVPKMFIKTFYIQILYDMTCMNDKKALMGIFGNSNNYGGKSLFAKNVFIT